MTMSTTTSRMSAYNGNGVTTAFAYTFKIADEDELVVSLYVTATEVETPQTISTHYTVSGVGAASGGNVTMLVAPPTGTQVRIRRSTPLTQPTSIRNQGDFAPETHEDVFDRLTRQIQELQDQINRVPVLSPWTTLTTPELGAPTALYLLRWNAAGTDVEAVSAGSLGALVVGTDVQAYDAYLQALSAMGTAADKLVYQTGVNTVAETALTSFARTLLDDTDASTARGTLSVYSTAQVDALVVGLLDFKGSTDCSANPNYPSALKGDTYIVSVAGKIGGASGTTVAAGDTYFALADNAGGTEAAVGSSWGHIEGNVAFTSAGLAIATAATAAAQRVALELDQDGFAFIIDGAGAEIADGIKGDLGPFPYACTLTMVTALADQSGSIVVDIWKDTYANFPPTDADSITAAAPVTISAATKSQDSTLTGWTVAIAAGDILRFNVDSCTTIQRCTIMAKVTR